MAAFVDVVSTIWATIIVSLIFAIAAVVLLNVVAKEWGVTKQITEPLRRFQGRGKHVGRGPS